MFHYLSRDFLAIKNNVLLIKLNISSDLGRLFLKKMKKNRY